MTWARGVAHIRLLFERQAGAAEHMHLHEHCADLTNDFSSVSVEVLFTAGDLPRTAQVNRYEGIRELVWNHLHQEAGIRRERVQSYGVLEEWNLPDFDAYREQAAPALRAAFSPKWVMLCNQFQNEMNTWGVSNMCCTVDLKVSDSVGENKQLVATMQSYGYRYSGEDVGVFGINRAGSSCIDRANCMHLWSDSVCEFQARALRAAGHDPQTVFFLGLAYRQMWTLYYNFHAKAVALTQGVPRDADDLPTPEQIALIHAFDHVEEAMIARRVLPDGSVLYHHGDQWVLWAVTATSVPLNATAAVRDVLADTASQSNAVAVTKFRIYTWAGAAPHGA